MAVILEKLVKAGVRPEDYLKKTAKASEWRATLETYNPEVGVTTELSKIKERTTIICFSAYWCKDCAKHVPALVRTLQEVGNKNLRLIMIDYDGNKKLAEEAGVKAIPTMIVFVSKGTEIGRIIEHPNGTRSIEDEVLGILTSKK